MGPRQRQRRFRAKTHIAPIIIGSFFGFMLLAGVAFGVGMIGVVETWLKDLPDYTDTDLYLSSEATTILDADGNKIASFYTQNRTTVSLDQISQYVIDGTVATEDERYYEHGGFDPVGILRAVAVQLTGGSEGASTITQQLVRNTILSDEQFDVTLQRKVREIYLAVKMEEIYSKDEILNMYLNVINYGHGAYGIEAASNVYFSKSAKDLTLAEAALLVGLPNAPSQYDPTVNPDYALSRRNTVLDRMLSNGYITQEEHDAAQAEPIVLNLSEPSGTGVDIYKYPYFVDYVRDLLSNEFDYNQIFSGGLTVETTIKPDVQAAAEAAVIDQLDAVGVENLQAGMTVIDNKTGAIVGMVGGRDYYADNEHTNHAITQRQTGSSFKAFTLATAIHEGMNPNIIINCNSPQTFDNGAYTVQNIGNAQYGYISLARATELSSNTGYVQIAKAVGVQNVIDMCHELGIDNDMDPNSSLTLGTEELSTLQMAEAFSTFASGGMHRDAIAITKITNRDGEVIYEHKDEPERVLETGEAEVVTNILEGVVSNGTAMTAQISVNQPFAGKTGTTENYGDLWFCGYTPQYSVAVWTGFTAGGSNTIYIGGSTASTSDLPQPIARNFFNTILDGVAREEFPTGTAPSYRADSYWEVDGKPLTGGSANTAETPSTETEDGQDSTSTTSPSAPTSPTSPTTSEPTPDPEPEEPPATTDPTPPTTTDPAPPVTTDPEPTA